MSDDNSKSWTERYSSPTEQQTEYGGFLSYAGEFHALMVGIGVGFSAGYTGSVAVLAGLFASTFVPTLAKRFPELSGRLAIEELRREPWYGSGGGLVSFLAGWVLSGRALSAALDAGMSLF